MDNKLIIRTTRGINYSIFEMVSLNINYHDISSNLLL